MSAPQRLTHDLQLCKHTVVTTKTLYTCAITLLWRDVQTAQRCFTKKQQQPMNGAFSRQQPSPHAWRVTSLWQTHNTRLGQLRLSHSGMATLAAFRHLFHSTILPLTKLSASTLLDWRKHINVIIQTYPSIKLYYHRPNIWPLQCWAMHLYHSSHVKIQTGKERDCIDTSLKWTMDQSYKVTDLFHLFAATHSNQHTASSTNNRRPLQSC